MKKFLLIACVIILLVLARDRADQLGLTEHAGGAARSATLPFKIAWLSMKEPDSKLVVPVEGIIVEGISNSWHAPRSGNRLHEGQD
ncbi:MAG: hypothetical protein M3R15_33765, partial [Acidobacteriota bacterium]|nr:hypothetical protein [Acidobacteriota bacterium]